MAAHPVYLHNLVRMRGKTRSYVLNLTRSTDEEEQLPSTLTLKDVVVWGGTISVPQASVGAVFKGFALVACRPT